jgi:16S rRNA processing protein RimM
LVARVRRAHGLRGEVAVEVLTDVPARLASGAEVEVVGADGLRRVGRIVASRPHRDGQLVHLEGVDDRGAAASLRGAVFEVPRNCVPPAPSGSFYYFELEDCSCFDRRAGALGRVVDVIEDGGGILLRVVSDERELLVPFVEAYLRSVDIDGGRIELDLPVGLIEVCASRS